MVHQDNLREHGEEEHAALPGETGQPAEGRQRKEAENLQQARGYHEALDRNTAVAAWWEERGFDEGLRRRFLLGAREEAEAIVPYWNRDSVQGFVLRNLELDPDKKKPLYKLQKDERFVSGYRPLFIPGPLGNWNYLVEDYVDALALAALGYPAVAVGGTDFGERQMEELHRLPGKLYVLPGATKDGAETARKWVEELYPRALLCPPSYGEEKRVD